MIELNDSNASYSQNGFAIFFDRIDADDDIFISSSCIFLSDITTTGKIRAQYNLTVYGSLNVGGDINIGGELQCAQLKGSNINIGGNLTVKDALTCNNLFVGGNVIIGSAYCTNIEVFGTFVSTGMVDATETILIGKSLVSLDFVQAVESITADNIIAMDVSTAKETMSKKILLSSDNTEHHSRDSIELSLSDMDISEIFNANSPLAICMEDCAVFLERLNDELCNLSLTDERLHRYISAFAEFFSEYSYLLHAIDMITLVLSKDTIEDDTWFYDFNSCVTALTKLPSWYMESQVVKSIHERILALITYQSTHTSLTKSFSTWINTNYNAQLLRYIYIGDPTMCSQLDHLHNRLLSNFGLKTPFLNLLFTQD